MMGWAVRIEGQESIMEDDIGRITSRNAAAMDCPTQCAPLPIKAKRGL